MHGNLPSPTLDAPQGASQPATTSHPATSAAPVVWATPGDRQAAARDAYRASITTGTPLTGAALGTMFDRSPRWGVDRIAEVRTEARQRSDGSSQQPTTAANGDTAPSNGNDRSHGHCSPQPIRSNGNGSGLLLKSSNRNGTNSSRSADAATATSASAAPAHAAATAPAGGGTAVTPAVRRITTTAVVAVALVAAIASYDHQRLLADMAGEGWRAWVLPLSVDGLVVAASMSMLVRRRMGRRPRALDWIALVLGVAVSVTANVAAAEPTLVGRLVAAWPPVALLLALEICLGIGGSRALTEGRHEGERR